MIKNRISLLPVLLLLSLTALGNSSLDDKIRVGEELMYNDPQRGIVYFRSVIAQHPSLPDSSNGYIQVMIGTCHAISGNLDSARFFMTLGINLLPEGSKRIYSLKNLGSVYRLLKNYTAADSVFSAAIQLVPKQKNNGNTKAALIGEKTSVYIDRGQYRTAIELLREGLTLCEQAPQPDTTTLYVLRNKLANIYMNTDNYVMAAGELEYALALTDSTKDLYNFTTSSSTLARAYLETGNHQRAVPLLQSSLNCAQKLNNRDLEGFVLLLLGKNYDLANQPEQALLHFRKAFTLLKAENSSYLDDCATAFLSFLNRWKMYAEGRTILSDSVWSQRNTDLPAPDLLKFKRAALPILENTLSHDEALAYYRELLPLMDSVTQLQLDQSLIDSKAQFQLKEQERQKQTLEQQNQLLAQENQLRNAQFLMVIVALAALVFLILYLVFRYRNKNLLHRQALERSEKEIQLREQRLEWEAKVRSLRDQVIQQQKQDLLKQVDEIDKLKEELTKASDSSHKTMEELLLRQLSDPKNRIGLEQFLHQFNAAFPTYFSNLTNQYPVLSNTDLQFCALLRLGLSIKDISNILAIEPKSTYKKKYRIEEKMGITEKGGLERVLFNVGG